MGRMVKDFETRYGGKSVQFVTFDVTDPDTDQTSLGKAKELGVEALYEENKYRTGHVILYDPARKTVLTRLSADDDLERWTTAFQRYAGS